MRTKQEHRIAAGDRFGRWTVLAPTVRSHHWLCRCDCGRRSIVCEYNLLTGKTTQCHRCQQRRKKPRVDYTGERHGHYTVVRYMGQDTWLCQCDCGASRVLGGKRVREGIARGSEWQCRSCSQKHRIDRERLVLVGAGLGAGMSQAAIARLLSLSRQRVGQMVKSNKLLFGKPGESI